MAKVFKAIPTTFRNQAHAMPRIKGFLTLKRLIDVGDGITLQVAQVFDWSLNWTAPYN